MNKRNTVILGVAAATLFHMNLVAHPDHDHGQSQPTANQEDHGHSHEPGETHDHSHPHQHSHDDDHDHDHSHAEMNIPEDLKELWGQVNLRIEQLKAALENDEHDKLHEIDEILSALLRALPERSPDLTAVNRRRVQGLANNLIRILDRIHDQADTGNTDGAQRQWQVLSRTLPLLTRHYPEEISSYKAEETPSVQHDHDHDHSHAPGQSHRHEARESSDPAHGEGQPHSHE